MDDLLIGIDIGGTKTAVVLGDGTPNIYERTEFPTDPVHGSEIAVKTIIDLVYEMMKLAGKKTVRAIGVSCGGPLDSVKGIILSPPNLSSWKSVHIVDILKNQFDLPVFLQNDANSCALAEWKWGAGKGSSSMVFMTFGTGLGAGLILNGKLYNGASGMAGEIGHIRLKKNGPLGYGKAGSFEGFCSGGGIAQLAKTVIKERLGKEEATEFCFNFSKKEITAKDVCEAAGRGDQAAIEILRISGEYLGYGLSILIDILNPERIIIGSIFTRCRDYLFPSAEVVIKEEALGISAAACEILVSALGERIGDLGSICVAAQYYEK